MKKLIDIRVFQRNLNGFIAFCVAYGGIVGN